MSNNRIWILLAAVVSVGVIALGWFIGVSPKLDEVALADKQQLSVEAQNDLQEARVATLKEQFSRIDELKADLAKLQLALPPGDDLSTFLGQLHDLEGTSGVLLTRFTSSDAQKYVPVVGSVIDPLVTVENFVTVPIGLTVEGTREQVLKFVSDLQYGKRLFLVNQLTVSEGDDTVGEEDESTSKYIGIITGFVYVLIDPASPPPTLTPGGTLDSTVEPSPSPSP